MFGKLRQVFNEIVNRLTSTVLTKELSYEDFIRIFQEFEISLLEADVAYEVVEAIKNSLERELVGSRVKGVGSVEAYVRRSIVNALTEILNRGLYRDDIVSVIRNSAKPYVMVFMGVNGVGKTTTIAKVGHLLKDRGFSCVVVASDTFRAGAQEQLEVHSKRLGIPFVGGKYRSDPAAVARDGVIYAQKNRIDVVLVDTAGRMHTDVDLMNEVKKVVRVVRPNMRVLVLDALTGNDAVNQAKWFDAHVGVDSVILTKLDADIKGGPALSIIASIGKPILYLGVGQRYEDLVPYRPELILKNIVVEV